jgi:ethanolamine utilization protein EutQ (cupin superfamily)
MIPGAIIGLGRLMTSTKPTLKESKWPRSASLSQLSGDQRWRSLAETLSEKAIAHSMSLFVVGLLGRSDRAAKIPLVQLVQMRSDVSISPQSNVDIA